MSLRLIVVIVALLFTAHHSAQAQPAARVFDSAGVRIVEHTSIKQAPRITLAAAPRLDLGGTRVDLREEFTTGHEFLTVEHLSDGRLVVNDRDQLKVFDASGKILQVIGRRGEGPGEFGLIRTVCVVRGDTIVAVQDGGRTTVFDGRGSLVRIFASPPGTRGGENGGCFRDGSLIMPSIPRANPASRFAPEIARNNDRILTVEHVGSNGSTISSLGPFSLPQFDFSVTSRTSVLAYADSIVVATGLAREYRIFTRTGRLIRIVRWLDAPIAVTDSMVGSSPGGGCARGSVCNPNPAPRRPPPATLPALFHVMVDPAGRVWVQDHILAPRPVGWTVFDASGALVGRLILPQIGIPHRAPPDVTTGVHIAGIRRDEVLLRWRDTTDGGVHLSYFPFVMPARR